MIASYLNEVLELPAMLRRLAQGLDLALAQNLAEVAQRLHASDLHGRMAL